MAIDEEKRESNLHILPVWKKGITAEEWFQDLALQARQYPERFQKMVLVYQVTKEDGRILTRYYCSALGTTELIGLLEIGKQEVLAFSSK